MPGCVILYLLLLQLTTQENFVELLLGTWMINDVLPFVQYLNHFFEKLSFKWECRHHACVSKLQKNGFCSFRLKLLQTRICG